MKTRWPRVCLAGAPRVPLPWPRIAALALALLIPAAPLRAGAPTEPPPRTWSFQRSLFADLWFGALATLGFDGSAEQPLYAPGFAERIRKHKARLRLLPTPLDRDAASLGTLLADDAAFEVLHFVPLYVDATNPNDGLDALEALCRPQQPPSSLGLMALASVLSSRDQREVLCRLVSDVREEWRVLDAFYEGLLGVGASAVLEDTWTSTYAGPLAEHLQTWGVSGGRAVVSPALGVEGRFFAGRPDDATDTRVMVGAPAAPGGEALGEALGALVRELCFPAVRAAFATLELEFTDRAVASRESDAAATRCGESLLARHLPAGLEDYRRRFGLDADSHTRSQKGGLEERIDATIERLSATR
ncbi:MAG: hypothetical protein R3E10_13260 [Gemmatimonadota bacterium]